MTALEVLSGIGVGAEVVVGRRVLEAILATEHTNLAWAVSGRALLCSPLSRRSSA
jgi:hypothetical protein